LLKNQINMTRVLVIISIIAFFSSCNQPMKGGQNIKKMDSLKTKLSMNDTINLPDSIINPKDSSVLIKISGGEFIYGLSEHLRDSLLNGKGKGVTHSDSEVFNSEFSAKNITLPTYYIDKYEITNYQFLKFIEHTGYLPPTGWSTSKAKQNLRCPVTNIGWADARAYAEWAQKRLPSEEEWEKAARGKDGRMWPWGNNPDGEKYNGSFQGYFKPVNVGSFPTGASPYGIMDMAGNVYEMTTGKWIDGTQAIRGGSFLNGGAYTSTTFRWASDDTIKGASWLGFRCVLDSVDAIGMNKN
jgi:formylglycine-generating enzyme required for sulfatase activity